MKWAFIMIYQTHYAARLALGVKQAEILLSQLLKNGLF